MTDKTCGTCRWINSEQILQRTLEGYEPLNEYQADVKKRSDQLRFESITRVARIKFWKSIILYPPPTTTGE